jgi:glycosyltransferase involved in cell wall biosynthesis
MESKPEKVLLFIDWYLPGYKAGGPVSSCANMIDALRLNFEFFVVTRNTEYCQTEPYPNIQPNEWVKRNANEHVLYLSEEHINYHKIKQIIESFDGKFIYINGIYSKYFSIFPLRIASKSANNFKIIVAARGMLSQSAIDVKRLKKFAYLRLSKALGWYRKVIFHATNQKEKNDIQRVFGKSSSVKIANNITRRIAPLGKRVVKERDELSLISVARISPEKNLLFLLEVLNKVNSKVHVGIYGQVYDENYWNLCESVIQQLPTNISVRYYGMVEPNAVSDKIQEYHFLVLPSLGENFGHVVAESFIAGRPVLISDQTPWRNLRDDLSGCDLSLANQDDWVNCLHELSALNQEEYDGWLKGAAAKGKKILSDIAPIEDHIKLFRI